MESISFVTPRFQIPLCFVHRYGALVCLVYKKPAFGPEVKVFRWRHCSAMLIADQRCAALREARPLPVCLGFVALDCESSVQAKLSVLLMHPAYHVHIHTAVTSKGHATD